MMHRVNEVKPLIWPPRNGIPVLPFLDSPYIAAIVSSQFRVWSRHACQRDLDRLFQVRLATEYGVPIEVEAGRYVYWVLGTGGEQVSGVHSIRVTKDKASTIPLVPLCPYHELTVCEPTTSALRIPGNARLVRWRGGVLFYDAELIRYMRFTKTHYEVISIPLPSLPSLPSPLDEPSSLDKVTHPDIAVFADIADIAVFGDHLFLKRDSGTCDHYQLPAGGLPESARRTTAPGEACDCPIEPDPPISLSTSRKKPKLA